MILHKLEGSLDLWVDEDGVIWEERNDWPLHDQVTNVYRIDLHTGQAVSKFVPTDNPLELVA